MPGKSELLITTNWHPGTIIKLEQYYNAHKLWDLDGSAAQLHLLAKISEHCEAVATQGFINDKFKKALPFPRINGEFMDTLPRLKIIANFGVGYDTIDVQAASERGIAVTNTPGVLTDDVADLAIGLMIASSRKLVRGDRFVREGKWLQGPMEFGHSLTGKKLGILGLGRIGEAIAQRAAVFKMSIAYHNRNQKNVPYPYYQDLLSLAKDSDILIAVIPGTPETEKIITKEVLRALGPEGTLINIARGSVVDEGALVQLLQEGRLGAAALDVFQSEPNVPQALLDIKDRVVLQPHHGSGTHETRAAMGQLVVDNLAAHFANKPLLNPVN
ncbi:MAG: 2-hydroxyacid dehydrogenase [SAR324 cluster bacterium]|nr:2-hydroxyacid dehydrogenase [SAR324 cluster bacterium]